MYEYENESCIVVPYSQAAFPDETLLMLYGRLKKEGLLEQTLGMTDKSLNQFVAYMSTRPSVLLCLSKPSNEIVGLGWLDNMKGEEGNRKADFGFFFYRNYWAKRETRTMSWWMLATWINELKCDVLYATSLKTNKMAINFSRRYGFQYLCLLPKYFYTQGVLNDAHLICLTRESFDPKYAAWKELESSRSRGIIVPTEIASGETRHRKVDSNTRQTY